MPHPPSTLRPGRRLELEALELVAGGDALARHEGLPIFVPGLVPLDRAIVEITEARKGYARGRVVELQRPSALRRAEPCPIAADCGGCDWTDLRLDAQLAAKRRILQESLRRTGRLDPSALPPIRLHPSPLNYRLRSRLHVGRDPETQEPALGFFARGSHRVVPITHRCEVLGRDTLATLHAGALGSTSVQFVEHAAGVAIQTEGADPIEIVIRVAATVEGRKMMFAYRLSSDSFFQVNRHLLGTLIELVSAHAARCADRSSALDLYSGVGFFTLPFATLFDRVVSVEEVDDSRAWAILNAGAGSNVDIRGGLVEELVGKLEPAAFVFVDPPRAGLHERVVEAIANLAKESICYLSCDPVTFSRDVALLARHGWRLQSLDLVDLFPNTHHLETLGAFAREH